MNFIECLEKSPLIFMQREKEWISSQITLLISRRHVQKKEDPIDGSGHKFEKSCKKRIGEGS